MSESIEEGSLRDRIWYRLVDVKFRALYACQCARKAEMCERVFAVGLAVGTSATVAAWSLWQQHSRVWAIIIGLAQLAAIARPFIPFLKNEQKYLSVSFELETVYLRLVRVWDSFKTDSDEQAAEKSFDELTDKWVEIEKHAPQFPKIKTWIARIDREKIAELRVDFPKAKLQ